MCILSLPMKLASAVMLLVAASASRAQVAQRTTLDIYFIDVEGGQSTLLVTPDGVSFLIDAGFPGTGTFSSTAGDPARARDAQRILAAARDAGIQRIDYLMLTHYHADHSGGVPELAQLLPIGTFIDHAAPIPEAEAGVPGTRAVHDAYVATRGNHAHLQPVPGDKLPIPGIEAYVVSSLGATLAKPLGGAGASNKACNTPGLPAQEKTENPRSLGVRVQFGEFRFLDVGDLSGAPLYALSCPTDMLGRVDAYLVAHHGGVDAAHPALFATVAPRVAIVNNGASKGGAAEVFATLRDFAGVDVWQLHRSAAAGNGNSADARIANLDESTSAWLKLSAKQNGSFTITNGRTGALVEYVKK